MKKLERLLLRGSGFSVLFLIIYYSIAAMMSFDDVTVGAGRFFTVLLFGYLLAMADFVFSGLSINVWLKRLGIYAVSAAAFVFIFIVGGGLGTSAAKIFAAIIIFTAIYAIGLAVILLIRRTLRGAEAKSKKRNEPEKKKNEKNPYKSLYEEEK